MVAEAAPATETQAQGDAGEAAANAAGVLEVNEYFEAQSKGSAKAEAPESVAAETPPELEVDEYPEITEAKNAAAAAAAEKTTREVTEKVIRDWQSAQAAQAATEEGRKFRANFAERANSTRQEVLDALLGLGADTTQAQAFAEKIAGRINEHNADGLKLWQPLAYEQASGEFVQNFNGAVQSALDTEQQRQFFGTTEKPNVYANVTEAFAAFKEAATRDMVTKSEAKAQAKLEVLKYQKWLEDNGRLTGTRSRQQTTGGTAAKSGAEPKTWQDVELMTAGIHPSGRTLSTAETRAYAQQFGHRLPR